jgi:TetR/AcrR family transcriptional repressor of nem operon
MARPRTFDEQDVVRRATELFWTKGYEATSIADISAEVGVHPGSLYRTFSDKHALFLRALAHYRDELARGLGPRLRAGGPVLPKIRAVLVDYVEIALARPPSRGCFIANSVGELAPADREVTDRLAEVLSIVEDGFLQGLRFAAQQGEIAATEDLAERATVLTMLLEGLQVRLKVESDPQRLVGAIDLALRALATPSWEGAQP